MQITVDVPEDIVAHLSAAGEDMSQAVLESLAAEGYRTGKLSTEQVRRLLGFATRMEVHGFLKDRGVYLNYGMAELEQDRLAGDRLAGLVE